MLIFGVALLSVCAAFAFEEKVYLKKIINDDKIVVQRRNHDFFVLELGLGCRDLSNYASRKISINSSGSSVSTVTGDGFTDMTSRIVLRNSNDCRIWSAKKLSTRREIAFNNLLKENGIY